jgi:acyl carrier protein
MPPDQIQEWMIEYLARELKLSRSAIDVDAPFETFAMDSAAAVAMTGELEDWLRCRIDPTTVYDYPTIAQMSRYLAGESGN